MYTNLECDYKKTKIKSEISTFEAVTPQTIIKMFKDNSLRESVCRFCLCEHNLRNYDDCIMINGCEWLLDDLLNAIDIKCQDMIAFNSEKICGECVQRITNFFTFTERARKTRQHFAAFLNTIYQQNVEDYDSLIVNDSIFHYDVDNAQNIDAETSITNIELKHDGFGSGNYDCVVDMEPTEKPKQKTIKIKFKGTKLKCTQCNKEFACHSRLRDHAIAHMEKRKCSICNRNVNPGKWDKHMKTHEPGYVKNSPKRKAKIRRMCDQCGYKSYHKVQLESHINKVHLNIRPYICHICSKAFHSQDNLREHVRTHNQKVSCKVCNKSLATACLSLHMRQHTGERPFKCQICNEGFISSTLRGRHIKTAHGSADVECNICGKMFHVLANLNRHKKTVHFGFKRKRNKKPVVKDDALVMSSP